MANGNQILGMDVFKVKMELDGGPDLAQMFETCRNYMKMEPDSGNTHLQNEQNMHEQYAYTSSRGQQVKIKPDSGNIHFSDEQNICEQNVHTFSRGQQVKIELGIGYAHHTNEQNIFEQNFQTFSGGRQVKIEPDCGNAYVTSERNLQTFSGGRQVKIEPDSGNSYITNEKNVQTFSGGQQLKIEPEIECGICEEKFFSIGTLNQHMSVHSQEELDISEASETSVKQETEALVNSNSQIDKKKHSCGVCYKSFPGIQYLKLHMKKHSREGLDTCNICFKPFRETGLLKMHQKTQTGKDNCMLVCKECSVSNRTEQGSADSVRPGGHAGMEKKCTLCPVVFPTIAQLKQHINRSHRKIQDGSQCLHCELCSKEFYSKVHLKKHKLRVHVTGRKHKCEECGSDFKTKSLLRQHMQGHEESRYTCQVCGKSFKRFSTFHSHRWRHQRDAAVKAALEDVYLSDD